MTKRLKRCWAVRAALLLSLVSGPAGAQQRGQQVQQNAPSVQFEILPIRNNVYMLAGDGGNIALSVGPDGAQPTKAAIDVATPVIVCTPLEISSI